MGDTEYVIYDNVNTASRLRINATSGLVTLLNALTIGGVVTATSTGSHVFGTTNTVTLSSGSITATGIIKSDTANTWPGLSATGLRLLSDATYGALLGGYGSTADLCLLNRSGSLVMAIFANSIDVYMSGVISAVGTGAHTFGTTNTVTMTAGVIVSTAVGNAFGTTTSSSTAVNLPASTTAVSSIRLAHGAAPSAPVNGDMWTTTAGLYVRINGATVGPLS